MIAKIDSINKTMNVDLGRILMRVKGWKVMEAPILSSYDTQNNNSVLSRGQRNGGFGNEGIGTGFMGRAGTIWACTGVF